MNKQEVLELPAQFIQYLPKAFQAGKRPYLFLLAWLALLVVSVLLVFSPDEKLLVPRLFIFVLVFAMYLLFQFGASEVTVVTTVLVGLATQIIYISFFTGGIFSSRLIWLNLVPLVAFYTMGKKQGLACLLISIVSLCVVAYCTAHGYLLEESVIGGQDAQASLILYAANFVVVLLIPYLYNNLFRNTFKTRGVYNRQLKETQEMLEQVSSARELFIATVSHELRTPMNAILGFNTLLIDQVQDKPNALKILQHTKQSADHLLTVINDVLDFSQLQAGKINIHNDTFLLRNTIDAAVSLFLQRLKSTQLEFKCVVDADVPEWVRTDRHRLMQVLVNLLGNAIKFTHQGFVHMRVSCYEDGVIFSIKDTGIGMADELQRHIFERFSQGEDVQSRFGGNGLGLSISKQLVELMGGKIGFESQQSKGSHFWFYLPLVAHEAPARLTPLVGVHMDTQTSYQFLVVDDHPINRLLARQILEKHWKNSTVVEADNGTKALAALHKKRFDLVLMDMVMPEMDGIEATQKLRRELAGEAAHIPVLGLTANVNPNDLERFAHAGIDGTVLKPFDQVKLCEEVQRLLNRKKSFPDS